jgi:transcriptional regulator with XRE-family HTH domain
MDSTYSLNELVASEIRGWLGKRRMSGRQLAAKMLVSQTWMSTRLRGDTEIGLNDLQRFATALNVQVTDLLPAPSRRSDQETNVTWSASSDQPPSDRPTGAPARAHHIPHSAPRHSDTPIASRTGTRRPRVTSWSHDGVTR